MNSIVFNINSQAVKVFLLAALVRENLLDKILFNNI